MGYTIHYTASSPDGTVEGVAAYQVGPDAQEPFPAIAYHWITDKAGRLYRCHHLATRVWHSGAVVAGVARNASHIGICWIGSHTPTLEQIAAMREAVALSESELGRELTGEGHGDVYRTSCPGPTWEAWRSELEKS